MYKGNNTSHEAPALDLDLDSDFARRDRRDRRGQLELYCTVLYGLVG